MVTTTDDTDAARGPGADCWCGGGSLRRVRLGGVDYLACDACGGELDRAPPSSVR